MAFIYMHTSGQRMWMRVCGGVSERMCHCVCDVADFIRNTKERHENKIRVFFSMHEKILLYLILVRDNNLHLAVKLFQKLHEILFKVKTRQASCMFKLWLAKH